MQPSFFFRRVQQVALMYLPAVLMAALALGTWWLVRSNPGPSPSKPKVAQERRVDYEMHDFASAAFEGDGRLSQALAGVRMAHYNTGEIQLLQPQLLRHDAQGQRIEARAQEAWTDEDAKALNLQGQVRITREMAAHDVLKIEGEQVLVQDEGKSVRADQPVRVSRQDMRLQGQKMQYEGEAERLRMQGQVLMERPGLRLQGQQMQYEAKTGQLQIQGQVRAHAQGK